VTELHRDGAPCGRGQGENGGDPWGGEREKVKKLQSIFIPTLGAVVRPSPFVGRLCSVDGVGTDTPQDPTRHMNFGGI